MTAMIQYVPFMAVMFRAHYQIQNIPAMFIYVLNYFRLFFKVAFR